MATAKQSTKIRITLAPPATRVVTEPDSAGNPQEAKDGDILTIPDDISKRAAGILIGVGKAEIYQGAAKKKKTPAASTSQE